MGSDNREPLTQKLLLQEHNKNPAKIPVEQIAVQAQSLHLLQQRSRILKHGKPEKLQKLRPRERIKEKIE